MTNQGIIKEYSNGEVTIVWEPAKCIHSALCFRSLPAVFNPQARPWVNVQAASTERLVEQVKSCPSGALSYKMNTANAAAAASVTEVVRVKVTPNGPLLVQGTIELETPQGDKVQRSTTTALCRCGASANKPYCDGSHSKIGFKD
ncbi:MAG: hypothetical protein E6Q85_00410 [Thiothrix sp.]|jgi:uncharacterized Fe-S cluster protein YjdI|nr:MAG: hypothetical protein E6Q85_00410 [Thiothrix sp.]